MTVSISKEKAERIVMKIKKFLNNPSQSMKELALIIGSVISIFLESQQENALLFLD